ncbi:MAG: poly(R)-hydroxyalkanoic acid synthase subunit PhaE [Thermodesulfobacteriota bacterium]
MNHGFPEELLKRISEGGSLSLQLIQTFFEAMQQSLQGNSDQKEAGYIYEKLTGDFLALYQDIIGRYLNAPQLGIPNELFQNILKAMDAHHRFSVLISEFALKFSKPFVESMGTIRKTAMEKNAAGNRFENFQDACDIAVGILEKKYDAYLKSDEGIADVARIVEGHAAYKSRMDAAGESWCRTLGIPGRTEVKNLSRNIYELRKQYRELNRRLDSLSESLLTSRFDGNAGNRGSNRKRKINPTENRNAASGNHETS